MSKVMVIGAGTMGSGIAQVFATHGWDVVLNDIKDEFIAGGQAKNRQYIHLQAGLDDLPDVEHNQVKLGALGFVNPVVLRDLHKPLQPVRLAEPVDPVVDPHGHGHQAPLFQLWDNMLYEHVALMQVQIGQLLGVIQNGHQVDDVVGRYPLPRLIGPDTFDRYAQPLGCRFLGITSLPAGGFVDILVLSVHGAPSFRVIRLHQAEQFRLSGGPVRP